MKLFDLTGQTALVTGSSMGIGFALARGLAQAGARVVINARNPEKLEEARQSLAGEGYDIETLSFDVTDAQAAKLAIDKFELEKRPISILINNAGMQFRTPLEEYPVETFDHLMRTNVNSIFYVSQPVAKHMIARGYGKIVNIASVQTAMARPGIAPYTTSKGAVANLTKGMATDWAKHGLTCNAIAPGYFDTPLNAALVADPEFCAWINKRTPTGRWGQIDELVGACIFLTSPASSFVNGQTIFVDGGMTACL
jgi:gluconate 5-dehydrogenase